MKAFIKSIHWEGSKGPIFWELLALLEASLVNTSFYRILSEETLLSKNLMMSIKIIKGISLGHLEKNIKVYLIS